MLAYRASAVLLVVLAALAGCKKKSAATGDAQPDPAAIILGPDPVRPGAPTTEITATTVIDGFDKMTAEMGQDKYPSFAHVTKQPVRPGGNRDLVSADATGRRADIDVAFAKFWTAWTGRVERSRQKLMRDQIDRLVKEGTPPDKARETVAKQWQPVPPLKVTTPNPDLHAKFFNQIEADVPNGVKGEWSQNGSLGVAGSVRFSESLKLHCNGDLTAQLRGDIGTLFLEANGSVSADLAELRTPVVEVSPNGMAFLRVGPGTHTVRLKGGGRDATILVRSNSALKVEGQNGQPAHGVVIAY